MTVDPPHLLGPRSGPREKLKGTTWTAGGCQSWYLDADGGTSAIWPGYTWQFRRALRTFDAENYRLRGSGRRAAQVPLDRTEPLAVRPESG